MKKMTSFVLTCVSLSLTACAPKIVVIDRQTVMQAEASGEFPDLEKKLQKKAMTYGPKMADRSKLQQKEIPSRSFQILNGELAQ